jgi:hypothetical protein
VPLDLAQSKRDTGLILKHKDLLSPRLVQEWNLDFVDEARVVALKDQHLMGLIIYPSYDPAIPLS